jgi:hypothetical protein
MVNVKTMIIAVTCLVSKFPVHLDTAVNFLMGWTADGQPATEEQGLLGTSACLNWTCSAPALSVVV